MVFFVCVLQLKLTAVKEFSWFISPGLRSIRHRLAESLLQYKSIRNYSRNVFFVSLKNQIRRTSSGIQYGQLGQVVV
jgi:hypothetical protein